MTTRAVNFNTAAGESEGFIIALRREWLLDHGFNHVATHDGRQRDLKKGKTIPPGMFETRRRVDGAETSRNLLLQVDGDTVADVFHDLADGELGVDVFSRLGGRHALAQLEALLEEWTVPHEVPEPEGDHLVDVGFWNMSERGPQRANRRLEMHAWDDVRRNYPAAARAGIERLVKLTEVPPQDGKLVLMHGPAGTGKTSLIRALSFEWQAWTQVDVISDPETFLTSPQYLNGVMMTAAYDPDRWRVLIMEDCGELLGGDAKDRAGQGLSRLLNISDGLLGQGQRLLFVITTNEDIQTLHPAVVRPDRCLANLHVGPFDAAEASEWLSGWHEDLGHGRELTLAELYQLKAKMGG